MADTRGSRRSDLGAVPAPRCAAMAVGSVPLVDPAEAVSLILRSTPEIPAWPQLPRRSFLENMYVQFSTGLPGLVVDAQAERVWVRDEVPPDELLRFVELVEADDLDAFAVPPDHAAGIEALRAALAKVGESGGPNAPFIKGQLTGPVSFGLTVAREDRRALLYDDTLREAATTLLGLKARWQERLLRVLLPDAVPLLMVDEPYLTQLGSALVTIPDDLCFPPLESCLLSITCLRGIHICGGTAWERIVQLPVDVISFDAMDHLEAITTRREAIADYVAQGGVLAWGVVPNDERTFSEDGESCGRRVLEGVRALTSTGVVSADDVLAASFVSPACGTGSLPEELALACFDRTARTSEWLRTRL